MHKIQFCFSSKMEADSLAPACLMTCLSLTCECHLRTSPCHKYQTMLQTGALLPMEVEPVFLASRMLQSHLATSKILHHLLTFLEWVALQMEEVKTSHCKGSSRLISLLLLTTLLELRKRFQCTGFQPWEPFQLLHLPTDQAWEVPHPPTIGGVLLSEATQEQSPTT